MSTTMRAGLGPMYTLLDEVPSDHISPCTVSDELVVFMYTETPAWMVKRTPCCTVTGLLR